MNSAVAYTEELRRILALPRRAADGSNLVDPMTALLKRPGGTMTLKPIQALALHDIGVHGGGFLPISVGGGKTLISLLAPYVLDAQRPLLLLPAGLIKKTDRDRTKLAKHWRIPDNVRLFSYEMLGRVNSALELEVYQPDLIVCDETHKLKNHRAAVTRRVARYMHDHPDTKFVAMSGTIMRKSLLDFSRIIRWALKGGAPVPRTEGECEEWAAALDEKVDDVRRMEPGELLRFCCAEEAAANDETTAARRGFQRRLIETPGVVGTAGTKDDVTCSLYIRGIRYEVSPETEAAFKKLRTQMRTPDDWELSTGVEVWAHARQMSLSCWYRWDPRPPQVWRDARRNWGCFVRETLSRSRTLDSELEVANACDAGKLPADALNMWRAIKPTFTPNVVAEWFDDGVLKLCADWAKERPGIIWTEHAHVAERLSRVSGLKYYGARGLAADGEFVDDADLRKSAILSIDANREGRNLQHKWSRMLMTSPPDGCDVWEQTIARLHRPGQEADVVEVDVLLGCGEHFSAMRNALSAARAVKDTTGAEQKLLIADFDWPSDEEADALATSGEYRWRSGVVPKGMGADAMRDIEQRIAAA